jgi:hypothetical protein
MRKKPPVRDDAPWIKRQEIPDSQFLDAADQYEEARKVLAELPPGRSVLLPFMNTASMAIELYLKSLSAELIHVKDELMPAVSRVYAEPAIMGRGGHRLVRLLDEIPDGVRTALVTAFDAEFERTWGVDVRRVLTELEGAFEASRYSFEYGTDITRYNLGHLMGLADFLGRFARSIPPTDRIAWKKRGKTTGRS